MSCLLGTRKAIKDYYSERESSNVGSDKSQFASLVMTAANNGWIKSVRPKVRLVLVLDIGVLEIPQLRTAGH